MRSEEEYEQMVGTAEGATTTTWWLLGAFALSNWWLLGAFALSKLLGSVNMDPVYAMLFFAQTEIFLKNLSTVVLPAPASLAFDKLGMAVNFEPDQYPAI